MCLDDHAKIFVMKIDGCITGVIDGEINPNGVAMMENGDFARYGIRYFKRGH